MTTSSDTSPDPREGVEEHDWEDDIECDTDVEENYGGENIYYYVITDTSFEDGWISSSESRDLGKKD